MTSSKPTCGVLAGEPVIIGERCADGGTCHHGCTAECFRRDCCVPLTASGLNDDWSAPVEEPAPMLCPACDKPMVDGQAFNGLYGCHWGACADKMREQERAERPPRKPTEVELAFEELRKAAKDVAEHAENLEAENFALQDQVKGLQELMAWVPVTERKPERNKLVLVAFDTHAGKNYTTAKLCQDGRAHVECEAWYVHVSGGHQLTTVTHWCDFERVPKPIILEEPDNYHDPMCKGDKSLGTACGKCSRCKAGGA